MSFYFHESSVEFLLSCELTIAVLLAASVTSKALEATPRFNKKSELGFERRPRIRQHDKVTICRLEISAFRTHAFRRLISGKNSFCHTFVVLTAICAVPAAFLVI